MLSDVLTSYGAGLNERVVRRAAYGCLSPEHAELFCGLYKLTGREFELKRIISGESRWPRDPEDADVLYFLTQAFRGQLLKELPPERPKVGPAIRLAHDAKAALTALAGINLELAQTVVAEDDQGEALPDWFLTEVYRDLPRIVAHERARA